MENATEKTPADMVAEYIALRDARDTAKRKFEDWLKDNITGQMETLEQTLMSKLDEMGVDSINAKGVGTAYKKLTTSVTTADAAAFRRHVIGEEAWDLVEWRPSKTAINDLVEKEGILPPGINRSGFYTVGIRRS